MSNDRWAWIEGIRPQTPVEIALSQMAKIFLEDLTHWPPEVAGAERRYDDLFRRSGERIGTWPAMMRPSSTTSATTCLRKPVLIPMTGSRAPSSRRISWRRCSG